LSNFSAPSVKELIIILGNRKRRPSGSWNSRSFVNGAEKTQSTKKGKNKTYKFS